MASAAKLLNSASSWRLRRCPKRAEESAQLLMRRSLLLCSFQYFWEARQTITLRLNRLAVEPSPVTRFHSSLVTRVQYRGTPFVEAAVESFDLDGRMRKQTRSTLATQVVGALHCCILGVLSTSLTALDTFTRVFGHECEAAIEDLATRTSEAASQLPHVQGGMLSLLDLVLEPSPLCCRSLQDFTKGSDRFFSRAAWHVLQNRVPPAHRLIPFSCHEKTETRLIFDAREANHGLFVGRLVCTERSWVLSFDIYVSVVKTRQRGPSPPLQLGPAQSLLAAHIPRVIFFDNFCGCGSRTEGCRGGAQGYDGEVYRRYGSMPWMVMMIFFLCLSSLQMDPNGARIAAKTAASRARSPQHGKQSLSSVWTVD